MPAKAPTATTPKTTRKTSAVQQYYYGTGKRKTAVARVRLYKNGKGDLTVNGQEGAVFFKLKKLLSTLNSPLRLTSLSKKFDISVMVSGGGLVAQAEAIRHGIARALLKYDEALRTTLKKAGFLTRDPRVKERKKPGLKRARRAPQFSKR
jgi:small subunit ribosomal protein S9